MRIYVFMTYQRISTQYTQRLRTFMHCRNGPHLKINIHLHYIFLTYFDSHYYNSWIEVLRAAGTCGTFSGVST